jgi:hypothetical protein
MMTHVPKNPYCKACSRAKTVARPHRAHAPSDGVGPPPEEFGDEVTADYLSVGPEELSWHGERFALVMYDRATRWLQCFPKLSSSAEHTKEAFLSFMGHKLVKSFYSDRAPEFRATARELGWEFHSSVPGRPQSNGVAERAVRRVIEGTRVVLEQSGFPQKWWSFAARHFCMAHNVTKYHGISPWAARHGRGEFKGLRIPFGALIDFLPSPVGATRDGKFAPNTEPGVFLGYCVHPGGIWRKAYYVASLRDFDNHWVDGRFPHVQAVCEVVWDPLVPPFFPAKEAYDSGRRRLTVSGGYEDVPPPPSAG